MTAMTDSELKSQGYKVPPTSGFIQRDPPDPDNIPQSIDKFSGNIALILDGILCSI